MGALSKPGGLGGGGDRCEESSEVGCEGLAYYLPFSMEEEVRVVQSPMQVQEVRTCPGGELWQPR